MSLIELLISAKQKGVVFYMDGGKLAFKAAKGALDPELKAKVLAMKEPLIAFLSEGVALQGPIPRGELQSAVLSWQQRSQYAINQANPDSAAYHVPLALRLEHTVSKEQILKGIQTLLGRHKIFSTKFRQTPEGVEQYLSHESPPEPDYQAIGENRVQWAGALLCAPFDLNGQWPYRICIGREVGGQHMILMVVHHIVFDGWSAGLLAADLERVFGAILEQQQVPPLPSGIDYFDYAVWQQGKEQRELASGLSYWQQRLEGAPAQHSLKLDRPRPRRPTFEGHLRRERYGVELAQGINQAARDLRVTPFALLQGLFALLIGEFSGQRDLVIGTPVANRGQKQLETLIGNFVNTLALRTRWERQGSLGEFIQSHGKALQQDLAQQHVPFESVVKLCLPEPDHSVNPLFQLMFSLQNNAGVARGLAQILPLDFNVTVATAKFDLQLNCEFDDEGLSLEWQYNTGLFDEASIDSLSQCFKPLIELLLQKPQTDIGQLTLLPECQERRLAVWNDTAAKIPPGCIHEYFAKSDVASNEQTALRFFDQHLSYAELNRRSDLWARYLQQQGVGPDSIVALLLDRSIDIVLAIHGVLKAGGAYLPLDPAHPEQRILQILSDAEPVCILSQTAFGALAARQPIFLMDDPGLQAKVEAQGNGQVVSKATADNLAYVIYTSGSTGQPKGVMVEHRALVNRIDWMQRQYPLTSDDVVMQKTPYTFDVSVWEFVWPFYAGASLSIAAPGAHQDPAALTAQIRDDRVSVIHFVPSMLTAMLHQGTLGLCSSLRLVFASGEALTGATVDSFYRSIGQARLHNLYGPTEAAIDVSYWHCQLDDGANIPIGAPIANICLYVLNERLQCQPIGAIGELYIGGAGLARGYLNQPQLTNERFIASPFIPGERLYKTGDLATWRSDGQLLYLGRSDFQVKLRGLRIELGEIEAGLLSLESIREAVVIVEQMQLIAYYTGQGLAPDKLKVHLSSRLPGYMVPEHYVELAQMPLSSNGKLDRKALPALQRTSTAAQFMPPQGAVETALAQIWQTLLNQQVVGREDSFFKLGGDSIIGIQVISRLRESGWQLQLSDLFEAPRLEALAARARAVDAVHMIEASEGEQLLPPIAIWYRINAGQAFNHFHQSALLTVKRTLDRAQLETLAYALAERHDVLRLGLLPAVDKGRYLPLERQAVAGRVVVEYASGLDDPQWQQWLALRGQYHKSGWDLENEYPFKLVYFVDDKSDRLRLLVILHHIAVDAVSWPILLGDLEKLLRDQALSPRSGSYQQWFAELARKIDSNALLPLAPGSNQSKLLPRTSWADRQHLDAHFPVELTAGWRASAADNELPFVDLLGAAIALSLEGLLGQAALAMDIELHGREHKGLSQELSQTLGWFTQLSVLDFDFSGLGAQVRPAYALAAFDQGLKQTSPFWEIWTQAPQPYEGVRDVLFNHFGNREQSRESGAEQQLQAASEFSGSDLGDSLPMSHDLVITTALGEKGLSLALDYNPGRFQARELTEFTARIQDQLEQLKGWLYDARTPRQLAQHYPLTSLGFEQLQALPDNVDKVYRATPAQQGILLECLLSGDSSTYVTQTEFTLEGPLDLPCFLSAWQGVADRHETLRSQFIGLDSGDIQQVILKQTEINYQLQQALEPAQIQEAAEAEKRAGFDLAKGPLFKLLLLKTGENQHKLLLSHHHVILDGWSLGMLYAEVFQAYQQRVGQVLSAVPSPGVSLNGYMQWLDKQSIAAAKNYWRERLFEVHEPSLLCSEPEMDMAGDFELEAVFSAEKQQRLREICAEHDLSLNTLCESAWGYLVSQWTGSRQVCFGHISSGREAQVSGIEQMLGLFIQTKPVVVTVKPDMGVIDWLQQRQTAEQGGEPGALPLFDIVRQSSLSQGPLFDSLFVFENFPFAIEQLGQAVDMNQGLQLTGIKGVEATGFALTLVVVPGEELKLKLQIKGQKMSQERARAIFSHYQGILDAMAAGSNLQLGKLDCLSAADKQKLAGWNQTQAEIPAASVLGKMAGQANSGGENTALLFGDERLSYAELARRSDQWAQYLSSMGVGPGQIVALLLERSIEMVLAIHGVLKAGGAYLPLDPGHPAGRNNEILKDAAPLCVLTQAAFSGQISTTAPVITMDQGAVLAEVAAMVAEPLKLEIKGDSLAYVIYTSGSTGRPKGVMIEHRALCNRIHWMQQQYLLDPSDVVMQKTPYTFDVSVWEFIWPFYAGAGLSIAPPEAHKDPQTLVAQIKRDRVSVIHFVPSMLTAMLHFGELATCVDLRLVFASGEALPGATVDRFYATGTGAQLHNLYGPTEAAIDVSYWHCRPGQGANTPIGAPIANIQLHVLDNQLTPLPVLAVGDLYIAGAGLARGYLNRPELTGASFIDNPFQPGERLYKTGDLAAWRDDGQLLYSGRSDFQVKLRGLRIELGEVEAALLAVEGIAETVVTVINEQLVAYYTGAALSDAEVALQLSGQLPDHMVPQHYIHLDQLPLSGNGKLDRKALPAPQRSAQHHSPQQAPLGDTEVALAQIWRELLRIEVINRSDNFFMLGGHSLLALKVIAAVSAQLSVTVSLADVFAASILSEQAALIAGQSTMTASHIEASTTEGEYVPLSFAQQRLWFMQQLQPQSSEYHMISCLKLKGRLNPARLQAALTAVQRRHGALRTRFVEHQGQVFQQIDRDCNASLVELTVADEAALQDKIAALLAQPFALAEGEVLHATLLHYHPDEAVLTLVIHHLVCDGVSLGILADSFTAAYGDPTVFEQLEPAKLKYTDFAQWQHQQDSEGDRESEDWWLQQLQDLPSLHSLPLDRPRPVRTDVSGVHQSVQLTTGQLDGIKALANRRGTSVFVVMQSLFSVLLHQYSRKTDVVFGSPIANRDRAGLQDLVGLFLNTMVLRHEIRPEESYLDFLGRVGEVSQQSYRHAQVPFERLVELLEPPRSLNSSPLFQIMINHINHAGTGDFVSDDGLTVQHYGNAYDTAKYDLGLYLVEGQDSLSMTLSYQTALFKPSTMSNYLNALSALIDAVIVSPQLAVKDLPLAGNKAGMILSGPALPLGSDNLALSIYASCLALGAKPALNDGLRVLSGTQLWQEALDLAYSLSQRLSPGDHLAVIGDRNSDYVVTLVAGWLAGLVLVPFEQGIPAQRLAHILTDGHIDLMVIINETGAGIIEGVEQISFTELVAVTAPADQRPAGLDAAATDTAYMIYTSGSTGKPKGVCGTHLGLVNRAQWMQHQFPYHSEEAVHITAFGFVRAMWELALPLLNGRQLHLFDSKYFNDLGGFAERLSRLSGDRIVTTPAIVQAATQLSERQRQGFGNLRYWFVSGEAFASEIAEMARSAFPRIQFINLYGSTEVTSDVSYSDDLQASGQMGVPLGRPIANTQMLLLDRYNRLLPAGIKGEIAVAGSSLANGYFNQPEQTEEKFVRIDLGEGSLRCYKTGDLGMIGEDGNLMFYGREDDQFNIRGFRVELGEITSALRSFDEIDDVYVSVENPDSPDAVICAYVASRQLFGLQGQEKLDFIIHARQHLAKQLPHYMLPGAIELLERLPLISNGKVDRQALRRLNRDHEVFVAARTKTELQFSELLSKLLHIKECNFAANFFDVGGNSILAARLSNQVEVRFMVRLPLAEIFAGHTLSDLAAYIEEQQQQHLSITALMETRVVEDVEELIL